MATFNFPRSRETRKMQPGCKESNEDDDKDSIVSERCWEEKYRGDSRKWLLRDGNWRRSHPAVASTMKEEYQNPEQDERQFVGKRRTILRQQFYDEVAADIIRERNAPPPVEEYCTEYDGNYSAPGFEFEKDSEKAKEMYLKYPLYGSQVTSYWKFQLDKAPRGEVSMPGLSVALDLKNPFKRNSGFTKPMGEVLDGADAL